MRKQQINPNDILESTIHLIAVDGLENLTSKKNAAALKISEGSLYNYFNNKTELITKCLFYVDEQIANMLFKLSFEEISAVSHIRITWFAYFNYLLAHPDYAKFYLQVRQSSYYTYEVSKKQIKLYSYIGEHLKSFHISSIVNPNILWAYIIETTLSFAVRMADGSLPKDEASIELCYTLLMNGISDVVRQIKENAT